MLTRARRWHGRSKIRNIITVAFLITLPLLYAKECLRVPQADLNRYQPAFPHRLRPFSIDGSGDFYSWSGRQGWEITTFDKEHQYGGRWAKGIIILNAGLDAQDQNMFRLIDKNGVAHPWRWLNQNDDCFYTGVALADVYDVHVFGIV